MGFFSKFALFVLNFLVFGVGVATVVLASIFISKNGEYGSLLASGTFTLPICILIAGLCILLLGFFGCCGALKENACMLHTYATIVLLLFIAEVVLGILIFVYTDEAEEIVTKGMDNVFNEYGQQDEALTKSLDLAQQKLQCCGVNGYKDWLNFTFGNGTGNVAMGCCIEQTNNCYEGVAYETEETAKKTVYIQGCYQAVKDDLQNVVVALGVTTLILGLVQLASISCACGLAKNSRGYA